MRRIVIIGLLLVSALSYGQRFAFPNSAHLGGVDSASWEQEYKDVYYEMTTPPSLTVADKQNAMVKRLVDNGFLSRMDWLYVFTTEYNSDSEALLNWAGPGTFTASEDNSPTWTQWAGYTGNSGTARVRSNYNPTNDSINITRYSFTIGAYIDNNVQSANAIDAFSAGNIYWTLTPRSGSDLFEVRLGTNANFTSSNSDSEGTFFATRRSNTESESYINGVSSGTSANTANGMLNANVGFVYYSSYTLSMAFLMDAISDVEADSLNAIFTDYKTGL